MSDPATCCVPNQADITNQPPSDLYMQPVEICTVVAGKSPKTTYHYDPQAYKTAAETYNPVTPDKGFILSGIGANDSHANVNMVGSDTLPTRTLENLDKEEEEEIILRVEPAPQEEPAPAVEPATIELLRSHSSSSKGNIKVRPTNLPDYIDGQPEAQVEMTRDVPKQSTYDPSEPDSEQDDLRSEPAYDDRMLRPSPPLIGVDDDELEVGRDGEVLQDTGATPRSTGVSMICCPSQRQPPAPLDQTIESQVTREVATQTPAEAAPFGGTQDADLPMTTQGPVLVTREVGGSSSNSATMTDRDIAETGVPRSGGLFSLCITGAGDEDPSEFVPVAHDDRRLPSVILGRPPMSVDNWLESEVVVSSASRSQYQVNIVQQTA